MSTSRWLGLDLGGTSLKAAVVEGGPDGCRVVGTTSVPTIAAAGPDAVIARLVATGRAMVQRYGPVAATGLGVPGLFDPAGGTVRLVPNLPGDWYGQPLRDRVADGLGGAVTLVNDARAGTLAEARTGAGRGAHTLVCVTLGTGIGGGIAVGGRLQLGAWGAAGEIGHQTVAPEGPACGCGNRGCLEAVAKASALARAAGRSTVEEVFAGVRDGDPRCRAAVDRVAGYLGIALANCVTVLGADRIVVGGGVAAAGDLLLDPVRAAVRARVTLVPAEEVAIVPAALGTSAGAVGAALAALDQAG